jgi:hypothetical protein
VFAACVATGVLAQPIGIRSPSWDSLSPSEKQFLAPIRPDWDNLDAQRKAKWRGIAQRYPSMTSEQQQRVQQQMGAWAQLTPAERAIAREQYKSLRSLPPEKKSR